jgi:probable RNA-binding protein EIF1AD
MGRTKAAERLFESIGTPPDKLEPNHVIACIVKARGNSLYDVRLAPTQYKQLLSTELNDEKESAIVVSMPPKFRNTIFVKRGGYILVALFDDTQATVKGEIANIVVNKKDWQRFPYWPEEFKEPEKGYEIDISDSDHDDFQSEESTHEVDEQYNADKFD